MIWYGTNPQRKSRFLVQEEGTAKDAQRRGNRAKVRVVAQKKGSSPHIVCSSASSNKCGQRIC